MPLQTFFNLPGEKRELITRCALDEFYEHGYDKASISRLVTKTGIAKGSFYQYFENLDDLYAYILQLVSAKKLEYSSSVMSRIYEATLLDTLRALFDTGIEFFIDHPKYAAIMSDFLKGRTVFHLAHKEESKQKGHQFFEELIRRKKHEGEINPIIDEKSLAALITFLSLYVSEYLAERYAPNYDKELLMKDIMQLLLIIEQGIHNKGK